MSPIQELLTHTPTRRKVLKALIGQKHALLRQVLCKKTPLARCDVAWPAKLEGDKTASFCMKMSGRDRYRGYKSGSQSSMAFCITPLFF